ncbi:MAG: PAS domain S-box protein [Syntrophobacteraceae bacterium]|nr:PAS domain S-box protein [Syntrophobacteraceae bacterium]
MHEGEGSPSGSQPMPVRDPGDHPLCTFDPRGVVDSANRAFLDLFSGSRSPVIGLHVGELIRPLSVDLLGAPPLAEGRPVMSVIHESENAHDSLFPVEWRVFPLLASPGSVEKYCAVGRAVSREILPPVQSVGGEALFREILENIEDVFWIAVPGRILYISPGYEKIWGLPRESLYRDQQDFLQVVHPDDLERVRKAIAQEMETGFFDEEYRISRPDGALRWIRARTFPILEDGTWTRNAGIAQDITAYKNLEESLGHESAFGKAVIEHAADGICVCHHIPEPPHIRFTVWNRRMVEITGYGMSEINRIGWYQAVYPDPATRDLAMRRMDAMREGEDLADEEWTITRADGTERILSISTSVFSVRDGLPRILAVMRDTTLKTLAEEKLKSTLNELEEKHREVTEANMALRVLLKKRDEDREEMRQSILTNLRHMVLPYIAKMKTEPASAGLCRHYCDVIERNLNEMASSFIWELSNRYLNLTPAEIRTAELLKQGRTTKEIAREMGVAPSTINTHREGLRRKLGITGKKTNLTTFLRMLK